MTDFVLDEQRTARMGLAEAVFCAGKSAAQIDAILAAAQQPMLLTRLDQAKFEALARWRELDYDPRSIRP